MGTGDILLGETLRWANIQSKGGGRGATLSVASCYRNQVKLRPCVPLWRVYHFTLPTNLMNTNKPLRNLNKKQAMSMPRTSVPSRGEVGSCFIHDRDRSYVHAWAEIITVLWPCFGFVVGIRSVEQSVQPVFMFPKCLTFQTSFSHCRQPMLHLPLEC